MPTVGEAMRFWEARFFVGRRLELDRFRHWLDDRPEWPVILNVIGPGSTGKTSLLSAFRNIAHAAGRHVAMVDGRTCRPSPQGLLQALGENRLERATGYLSERRALVLLDSFEDLTNLTPYLFDTFLTGLDTGG